MSNRAGGLILSGSTVRGRVVARYFPRVKERNRSPNAERRICRPLPQALRRPVPSFAAPQPGWRCSATSGLGAAIVAWLVAVLVFGVIRTAEAGPLFVDEFGDASAWTATGSDGVDVRVGTEGGALRVDFDFRRGSGFLVFRREVGVDLPANWAWSFNVRGECPVNNFEFKLIDETGDNVWWVNQRAYEFPRERKMVALKKRHFSFAWGPGGAAKALTKVKAVELAVAAGTGGKGTVWISDLRLEMLPETAPAGPMAVSVTTSQKGQEPPGNLPEDGAVNWRSAKGDAAPAITVDFGGVREFGGVSLEWGEDHAADYDVEVRTGDGEWRLMKAIRKSMGGVDHVPMRECEGRAVRVRITDRPLVNGFHLERMRVRDIAFSAADNDFFRAVAAESPRGRFPRSFLGEQSYWTVFGAAGDEDEALMSEDGAIELGKGGPTIEPFLLMDNRVWSWADVEVSHALPDRALPVPIVQWDTENVALEIMAGAERGTGRIVGVATVKNKRHFPARGFLALTLRPFQAMPATQNLNMEGGVSRIRRVDAVDGAFRVDGRTVAFTEQPWAIGGTPFATGEIVELLDMGEAPEEAAVDDESGFASGAAAFLFDLDAFRSKRIGFVATMRAGEIGTTTLESVDAALQAIRQEWTEALATPVFRLPKGAERYAETFRSTVAYILINRDGPAIQPGSRAYDRTWIRDGALTSTALHYAGHHAEVREFLDWFAPFQYENGKIPCCADERGPDPVPEHDSHGEYIYAVAEYDRFMGDDGFVRAHLPRVAKAVDFIESLRATRMTEPYQDGSGLERAKFGLMPESISHEGYSSKPMHSYWDDFWTLRGLEDAAYLARRAGDAEFEARAAGAAQSMRACLYESMRLAMAVKKIEHVPGCVELGDFDATSTSIGVFPVGELGRIPEPALTNTFDRYARWFDDRAAGRIEWRDYTPYEIRNTTTFLFLGRRDVTHRMMEFFFKDQRPAGWNAWAEVVRNGYRTPGFIGDLPHTWVASDFVKLLRTMFVHERGDGTLVVGMGITREWMESEGGASAEGLPTHFGELGLSFFSRDGARVVQVRGGLRPPTGGVEIALEDLATAAVEADGRRVGLNEAGRLVIPWPVREIVIRRE